MDRRPSPRPRPRWWCCSGRPPGIPWMRGEEGGWSLESHSCTQRTPTVTDTKHLCAVQCSDWGGAREKLWDQEDVGYKSTHTEGYSECQTIHYTGLFWCVTHSELSLGALSRDQCHTGERLFIMKFLTHESSNNACPSSTVQIRYPVIRQNSVM